MGLGRLSLLEDDWSDWRFRNVCDPALFLSAPAFTVLFVRVALCHMGLPILVEVINLF